MNTQKKTISHRVLSGCSIAICVIVLPVLIINLIIIVESRIHPDDIPEVFGLSPMIVMTESMDPTIKGGDMIIIRRIEPEDLEEGDIISFFDPSFDTKSVNTHRIIEITNSTDGLFFITKGDANNTCDSEMIPEENVVGIYAGKLPGLGKLVLFMKTPLGITLFVILPLAVLGAFDTIRARKLRREAEERIRSLQEKLESLKNRN